MSRVLTRLSALLAALCLLVLPAAQAPRAQAAALDPFTGYLMAHFTGESATGEQVYFAHSRDGLTWRDLNNGAPVLLSTIGTRGVRDPSIVRSPSGDRYWIVATDLRIASGTSWNDAANRGSRSLVVWESRDLVNWSAPWLINVAGAIPGAGNAWAPEAIYNAATGDYVVYWATNSLRDGVTKHRIWYVRTSDFRSFTAPQLYIERPGGGQGIIDTQIVEVPNAVGGYRYYRASADGHITIEASNSILGSWTTLGNLSHLGISNGTGGGNVVEGPMWMQFNGRDEWALWLDQYATGRGYLPVTSTNLGSVTNFRTRTDYQLGASRKRHGSILNLTAAEESAVLGRWGATTPANRIQAYTHQDRYVRHANYDVRIDANVSPAQDAQFRVVPGLADAGAVSFESVNYPGHYLRHYGFDFVLAAHDGSSVFAADATFRQVAGLANSSWSSFRSYNYPDRYLRHYNYQLRLDPINDAQARADATFRLTS
ncbi:glycoside hydrolase family 43 protein [Verrucosispora sp. WMMA2044]|uniref:Family 43 glycosylhydrolase n=1 Tax=Verrucosispora sioxanthis TaxID=2499994 RepID=A0A6M1KZD8_9ACTN|nr:MULTISPECIES: glycoside hydrolase family 43 protein [Micromonospora]NEE63962.1 family 43 glycosylhydrolase [Verrucosispora sioxanthis]NGM13072.1 family 43 glycosylhydrolase [Verrucosispora sioxanthis]WBB51033.1 glycoside hydrolase family 43 protein [Verrucosispora sp. WMMA2044]